MNKIPFEDGKKLKNAFVTIDGKEYEVTPAQYQGKTPVSASNLNKMQDNIEKSINGTIETVTTESGTAIKFADGTMICYGKIDTGSRNFTEQFGSVYYDNIPYNIVYPMQFIETPIISISQELGGYLGGNSIGGLPTNTKAQVYVYTMKSATLSRNAIIYWQAIGRWK